MVLNERTFAPKPRKITILGSTGSIGCNTLDLIQRSPEAYEVESLTANKNVDLLAAPRLRWGRVLRLLLRRHPVLQIG